MAKSQLSLLSHRGSFQALILIGTVIASAIGIAPAKDAPKSLAVFPDRVSLETNSDFHKLVVLATYADGATCDVTSKTRFQCEESGIAKIEGATLTPQKDGKTTISASFGGLESTVSVVVSGAAAARPVSYNLDVMPLLMRHGCNTGSCHGTARGRDGFMLSLFGYDPDCDYHRITREMGARRINTAVPEASLSPDR